MTTMLNVNFGAQEVIMILAVLTYLYCLYHLFTNKSLIGSQKLIWLLIILFIPLLGCIAYLMYGRNSGAQATR